MNRVLNILRSVDKPLALEALEAQRSEGQQPHILLLQDAVCLPLSGEGVFRCQADVEARGLDVNDGLVDYGEIVDLIGAAEKVICW